MFAFVREHVLDMILAYFQSWKLDLKLAHHHFRKRSRTAVGLEIILQCFVKLCVCLWGKSIGWLEKNRPRPYYSSQRPLMCPNALLLQR